MHTVSLVFSCGRLQWIKLTGNTRICIRVLNVSSWFQHYASFIRDFVNWTKWICFKYWFSKNSKKNNHKQQHHQWKEEIHSQFHLFATWLNYDDILPFSFPVFTGDEILLYFPCDMSFIRLFIVLTKRTKCDLRSV